MKFKHDIEAQAGFKDKDGQLGLAGQILSSTGSQTDWIDQGDVTVGEADKAKSVVLRVKNSTASAMSKGQVICEAVSATPPSGNLIEVALADNNGTNTMPALGILNEDLDAAGGANDEGDAIMFGKVSGIDTSAFSVGDEVFVSSTPGALTTTKPTGVRYIQKVGVVIRDDANNGTIEVFGAGRVNDVPTPLYIDHANQRLGINETNPTYRLHVDGGNGLFVGDGAVPVLEADSSSGIFSMGDTDELGDGVYITNTGTSNFDIYSTGSIKFRMDSNGNVGIGATSPGAKLEVEQSNSSANTVFLSNSFNNKGFRTGHSGYATFAGYQDSNNTASGSAYGSLIGLNTFYNGTNFYSDNQYIDPSSILFKDGNIIFHTNDISATGNFTPNERLIITKTGNVGIGTISPAHKLDVVGNVKISSGGLAIENSTSHGYVALPGGAFYHSTSGGETGAIKITLPTHGSTDMLSFVVDIFDYSTNESFTVNIKGYLYQTTGNNEWVNVSAQTIASNINRNFTIRFGADGSNNCVWIGETSSFWSYPQVQVRDFTAGYTADIDDFIDGWDVDVVTSFDTVDLTYFSPFPMSKEVYGSGIHLRGSGNSYFNGGNVGIGTTGPGSALEVQGEIDANGGDGYRIETKPFANWASDVLTLGDWDGEGYSTRIMGSNSSEVMRVTGNNVGIGTISPSQKLDVSGNIKMTETAATTDTDKFIVSDGGVLKYRTGAQVLSDIGAGSGDVGGSGTTNYIPKWSNSSTLTDSGIVETSTLTTINNDSFEYDYSGTTYLNVNGSQGTFLIGQHSTANRVWIHGIQTHLRFYTNNAKAGEFDSNQNFLVNNGNVGIGTTSTSGRLTIGSGSATDNSTMFNVNGQYNDVGFNGGTSGLLTQGVWSFINSATWDQTRFYVQDQNNVDSRLTFDFKGNAGNTNILAGTSTGKVGIGTTSPSEKLHVYNGTAYVTPVSYAANQSAFALKVGAYNNTAFDMGLQVKSTSGGSPYMSFKTSSTDDTLTIWQGSVGVGGIGIPSHTLDVSGTGRFSSYLSFNNQGYIRGDIAGHLRLQGGTTATTFYNSSNSSELLRIENGGNVGIGITSPSQKFHVNGTALVESTLYIDDTSSSIYRFFNELIIQNTASTSISIGGGPGGVTNNLEVNGAVTATAATDAYKGYIKQNVIGFGSEKIETSDYYFTSYNTTSTVITAQPYNRIVAAYNGRVKKVFLRHGGGQTPTATAVNFKKHTNGVTSSTVYAATVASTASTNMTAYYEFANSDFTFNAGDLIGLLYQTTDAFGTASKTMGAVAVTIILEYNIT